MFWPISLMTMMVVAAAALRYGDDLETMRTLARVIISARGRGTVTLYLAG